jgi:predicted AlkP superfamily phosphohydrolase/phosphomutase
MGSKVILLGIDGATLDLLLPWVELGKLPNLGRVLRAGAHGTLRSTIPPYSAQAWVSMMTGKSPAKHGVLDFFEAGAGPGQHAFISSALIKGEAIWDTLSRHGKRVGIVNVPLTYPPMPVNGYMVSGFMTPKGREDYTYPAELRSEILSVTDQYEPDPWDLMLPGQDLDHFKRWMDITEQAAIYLHDRHAVDVYVNVIQALDQLQHSFWDLLTDETARQAPQASEVWSSLESCYARMDEAIGRRLEWLDDDTTLFLSSDHGFQAVNRWFHVNHWLADRGFLHFAAGQVRRGKSALARVGLTRENIKRLVRQLDPLGLRRLLGRFARASIADKLDDALALPIDWSRTVAYSGSRTSEGIYVNLKGREPHGIVTPGHEYEDVRTQIMDELASLVDPGTSQPALSAVYRREELYSGEFLPRMPDILFGLDNKPYLVSESTAAKGVFEPIAGNDVKGRHHTQGTFAALGPHIVGGLVVQADIVDIAPTILYAMDLPIPEDMDGRVLEEVFAAEYRQAHPVRYEQSGASAPREGRTPVYTEEEEEELQRRLRDLGYLS